jgi:hypothetical protein
MRYLLSIYSQESDWTEAERTACYSESGRLAKELEREGRCSLAHPLQPISTATSVRVREGKTIITDGPFAETREQFGGIYLITAEDLDGAIAIAARVPGARKGTVEIRPLLEL